MRVFALFFIYSFSVFAFNQSYNYYPNTFSTNIQDPLLLQQYWLSQFENIYFSNLNQNINSNTGVNPIYETPKFEIAKAPPVNIDTITNEPTEYTEGQVNEELGQLLVEEYIETETALVNEEYAKSDGASDCILDDPIGNISNDEILSLSQDVMDVVAYLEKDREEKNGSSTRDEVFKVSDALLDKQLELFDKANELEGKVSRKDKFLIRTVKDPDLNEEIFKRRAKLIEATIDVIIQKFEETGNYTNFPSTLSINKRLNELGLDPNPGEARYMSYIFMGLASKFQEDWKFLKEVPPKGSSDLDSAKINKLKSIKAITEKVLDDNSKLSVDEFNYYAYFMSSPRQETTIFVQPEDDGPYLPFKQTRPIEGPS